MPTLLDPPRARRWVAGLWTLAILVACWLPRAALPVREGNARVGSIPHLDKVIHFSMFVGFGYLWILALPRGWSIRVLVLGIVLAIVSELGQNHPWVGRDAGLDDGLADTFGLAFGITIAVWWLRHKSLGARQGAAGP
jgi:VanZ family protein